VVVAVAIVIIVTIILKNSNGNKRGQQSHGCHRQSIHNQPLDHDARCLMSEAF